MQYNKTSPLYAPSSDDTSTDANKKMTDDLPIEEVDDSTDPVDIPPMTENDDSANVNVDTDASSE